MTWLREWEANGRLIIYRNTERAGHNRWLMGYVQVIAEHQLQRVLPRRQLQLGFTLTLAEMANLLGTG